MTDTAGTLFELPSPDKDRCRTFAPLAETEAHGPTRQEDGHDNTARGEAQKSIDALVTDARRYQGSKDYRRLLEFVGRFRGYSPFNALLVDIQRPGSRYVATAWRWRVQYERSLRAGARALVILQPFGPVMFVYDVSDTVALPDAPRLPPEVINPFEVRGWVRYEDVKLAIDRVVESGIRDGVRVEDNAFGAGMAGQIARADTGTQLYLVRKRPEPEYRQVPARFTLAINSTQRGLTRYATLAHELGHLYCGHLGTPNPKWWPDRRHVDHRTAEFEAESVSVIATWRLDPSAEIPPYLAQYLDVAETIPEGMSLERVMSASGLVCDMSHGRMPLRT